MANYRAVSVVSEALTRLLEASYDPSLMNGTTLQFDVYRTADFKSPMESGISLFVYRVVTNDTLRTPPGRPRPGRPGRPRPRLALDVHFLLTAWGKKASLEQAVMGWAMRVLQDRIILSASVLNSVEPGTFDDDETVEVVFGDIPIEDLMRIWDGLPADYQISTPFVARVLKVESLLPPRVEGRVETRTLGLGMGGGGP